MEPASRIYRFTYQTTIPAPPTGTGTLDIWLPLPLLDPGVQEVANLAYEVKTASQHKERETRESKYGNRMLHVQVSSPTAPVTVSWTADVTRFEDVGQGTLADNPWYMRSNDLIPLDGRARTLADQLRLADASEPVRTRMHRLYDDVLGAMAYDKNHEGWGRGSFEHATTICKGNCTDFHARFIGTARAGGFSARFTMGIPMKPGDGAYNSYHCWAHWRDNGVWRPVDISEADKILDKDAKAAQRYFGRLDPDRLALTFGRDITLEPAQKGPALNYFVFPHAEADGVPVALDKNNWEFRWQDRRS